MEKQRFLEVRFLSIFKIKLEIILLKFIRLDLSKK